MSMLVKGQQPSQGFAGHVSSCTSKYDVITIKFFCPNQEFELQTAPIVWIEILSHSPSNPSSINVGAVDFYFSVEGGNSPPPSYSD